MTTIPVGGHLVDCTHVLRDRLQSIFTDENGYTALRTPLEKDLGTSGPAVRVPICFSGWPDPENRETPNLPFIAVRAISGGQAKDDRGEESRHASFMIVIGVRCEEVLDYEYAVVILERIWRNLAEQPYLSEGKYLIEADGIEWTEAAELMKVYPAHILGMTVPVILPAFIQTEDMHGDPIFWENGYPNP